MEPIRAAGVVSGNDFVHQIKWDGIRGVSVIDNERIRLFTRKGVECTYAYPELFDLPEKIHGHQAVLDGELVSFEQGKPSFYLALRRNRTKTETSVERIAKQYPVKYIVFDILSIDGKDLRSRPLFERQKILSQVLEQDTVAALNENFDDGQTLLELMRQKDMEGIVSKRLGSSYTPGKKHGDWYKTKTNKKMLCAVIGINIKNERPASLMLGLFREGNFEHVGNVSSGLSQSDLKEIKEIAKTQGIKEQKNCVILKPQITCWVKFSEWTHHGTLRHPVLIGFSEQPAAEAQGKEISV